MLLMESKDMRMDIPAGDAAAIVAALERPSPSYRMFEVKHATYYEYSEPVEQSDHIFKLQPTTDRIQEVVRSSVTISESSEEVQYEDVFGNQAIHCLIDIPYTKLFVKSSSLVRVYATRPDDHSLSRRQGALPLVWMPWQRQMMMPYLLPPELPESQLLALTEFATGIVQRNNSRVIETVEDLNLTIFREFKYTPGSTNLSTTAFDVLNSRQGVCQDFANLFICLMRLLNIPARYRMGYIRTGADHENKIQSDASHAWVEIYLPYLGWRGFDPTNGCAAGQDHIRVACGRDYLDATPTSGTIYKGGGAESLRTEVEIREI